MLKIRVMSKLKNWSLDYEATLGKTLSEHYSELSVMFFNVADTKYLVNH